MTPTKEEQPICQLRNIWQRCLQKLGPDGKLIPAVSFEVFRKKLRPVLLEEGILYIEHEGPRRRRVVCAYASDIKEWRKAGGLRD